MKRILQKFVPAASLVVAACASDDGGAPFSKPVHDRAVFKIDTTMNDMLGVVDSENRRFAPSTNVLWSVDGEINRFREDVGLVPYLELDGSEHHVTDIVVGKKDGVEKLVQCVRGTLGLVCAIADLEKEDGSIVADASDVKLVRHSRGIPSDEMVELNFGPSSKRIAMVSVGSNVCETMVVDPDCPEGHHAFHFDVCESELNDMRLKLKGVYEKIKPQM